MTRRNEFLQGALVLASGMLLDRILREPNLLPRMARVGKAVFQILQPEAPRIHLPTDLPLPVVEDFLPPPVVPLASQIPPPDPVRGTGVFTRTFEEMEALETLRSQQAEKGSALENKTWLEM